MSSPPGRGRRPRGRGGGGGGRARSGEAELHLAAVSHPGLQPFLLVAGLGGLDVDAGELGEVSHGAPLLDAALEGAGAVDVGVPVLPLLVGRENKTVSLELNEASLDGDANRIAVQQTQQQIVLDPAVELVDDDGVLALVAVEPDVAVGVGLGEDIGVRVLGDGLTGLARARVAPVDEDDGGGVGVPVGRLEGDEGLESLAELDDLDRMVLSNVLHRSAVVDLLGDGLELGPVGLEVEICVHFSSVS